MIESGKSFSGGIVGIGASAGGLEALEQFFDACPSDTGAAFVVIQHLSPDHKSMMNDLLRRHTPMPVVIIEDQMPIEANRVHLIPPGKLLKIHYGVFTLQDKQPHVLTLPIDIFFNAMAEQYGARCVGITLSGTGSDGTRGSVAINAAGGFLLAQDPHEARFNGMPNSVIATNLVDEVGTAQELATHLPLYIKRIHSSTLIQPALETSTPTPSDLPTTPAQPPASPVLKMTQDELLECIFQALQQACGVDFREYKMATVLRRIERRMQVLHLNRLEDYWHHLQQERTELMHLRRELLICVTSFFRDADAFTALNEQVIQTLVAQRQQSNLRVWCAGVSRGEEAYSIAMLFLEAFEQHQVQPELKIFATDVNPYNIECAGAGAYPETLAAEIDPQRLERFFTRCEKGYTVQPELRQAVVFAQHNLLADPPFTRMDLVVCRNTLIYFKPLAQRRALTRLQYALKPKGYLFLGSSESAAELGVSVQAVNEKQKIFQRTHHPAQANLEQQDVRQLYMPAEKHLSPRLTPAAVQPEEVLIQHAQQLLTESYAPPALLVNGQDEVLHFFGQVQDYLHLRPGVASMNLVRLLPEALIPVATALLYKARKEQVSLASGWVTQPFKNQRPSRLVPTPPQQDPSSAPPIEEIELRLVAHALAPLADQPQEARYALLCFETHQQQPRKNKPLLNMDKEAQVRIGELELELTATRESLQATIEEFETANEELQSTNEELRASNEELQSSNEELQSLNEELNTVNAEYQEKVLQLNQLYSELDTMGKALGIPTIFVNSRMCITRFTPDAQRLFKLREGDLGRPLDDIVNQLQHPQLRQDVQHTLDTGESLEKDIITEDGHNVLLRIMPYQVRSSVNKGAVASFIDVTALASRQQVHFSSASALSPRQPIHLAQDSTISRGQASRDEADHDQVKGDANE